MQLDDLISCIGEQYKDAPIEIRIRIGEIMAPRRYGYRPRRKKSKQKKRKKYIQDLL